MMLTRNRHGKQWEKHTQAGQCVDTINVHGTRATDTLSATPSESQSRINLVLDSDKSVEHHGTSLVQVEGVRLHLGLRGRLIGVPAVDVERLDLGILVGRRLLDSRRLALGNNRARSRDGLCNTRDGLDGRGKTATEHHARRKARGCESERCHCGC